MAYCTSVLRMSRARMSMASGSVFHSNPIRAYIAWLDLALFSQPKLLVASPSPSNRGPITRRGQNRTSYHLASLDIARREGRSRVRVDIQRIPPRWHLTLPDRRRASLLGFCGARRVFRERWERGCGRGAEATNEEKECKNNERKGGVFAQLTLRCCKACKHFLLG